MDREPAQARYQGRRRVPTPPHGRYAAIMTAAVLGAGIVTVGARVALPTHGGSFGLTTVAAAAELDDRALTDDRASRNDSRSTTSLFDQPAPDVWLLPVKGYEVSSTFGERWGKQHAGVDLATREGTPFYAAAAGLASLCRWYAGYGYNVQIDHGGGITTVYGHASKLLCRQGQKVQAGDTIALVGNTGDSYGSHLHFEVRQNNKPIEPVAFMRHHGVDIMTHAQAVYGDKVSD